MSHFDFSEMQDKVRQGAEAHNLDAEIVFKPMFGGICAYISGRVFASLSNVGLAIKLPPKMQDQLLQVAGAKRLQYEEDSPPSKQYIVVPSDVLADTEAWERWFQRSVEHVLTLPAPKSKTNRK